MLKAIRFDLRLNLLKVHVGVRIRPLIRSWKWFPYGLIPTCLWLGPIEFTVFAGKYAKWLDFSCSVDFDLKEEGISFRFNPFWWELGTTFSLDGMNGYFTAYPKCGPLHIYAYKWLERV
ncbi:MAG: hypothetical protein WC315_00565 [Candidatus Omnitrophota bacterium]|jgi:hypothetical protein